MNNDFEKNNNFENETADSASELNNCESTVQPVISENVPSQEDTVQEELIINEAEPAENEKEITESLSEDSLSDKTADVYDNCGYSEKPAIPGGDSYFYSKGDNHHGQTVGCVWDNKETPKKLNTEKSGSGFKVFVAAMLGVFTMASVTIAGFLAADYLSTKNATTEGSAESGKQSSSVSYTAPVQNHTVYPSEMVSSFTVEGTGLTKSQVAAKCSPSAVGIVVEATQTYSGYSYSIPYFGDFGFPGGTQIVRGSGSGFVYSADGYIITNHHVIEGATKITVHFLDGKTAEATLVGSDSFSDIAVIKVDPTDLTLVPMEIGDSSLMKVGDEVIAIGCPAGIEFMGTVTDGIISAINRDVELDNDGSSKTKTMTLLQTNATINRGNSGGPLINSGGQVIGINTLKLSADYEGIGFSIPINGALPIISQLIEHGKVIERTESFVSSEGMIGISTSNISEQESKYYEIPQGILVVQIAKDSSASKAGLRRGDIITAFNGEEVKTTSELNEKKSAFKAGDSVTLTVYRDSDELTDKYFDITFTLDVAS